LARLRRTAVSVNLAYLLLSGRRILVAICKFFCHTLDYGHGNW
jgi:hypothetical protein